MFPEKGSVGSATSKVKLCRGCASKRRNERVSKLRIVRDCCACPPQPLSRSAFPAATDLLCPIYFRLRPFLVLTFILFGNCGAKFWKIFRHEFHESTLITLGLTD